MFDCELKNFMFKKKAFAIFLTSQMCKNLYNNHFKMIKQ